MSIFATGVIVIDAELRLVYSIGLGQHRGSFLRALSRMVAPQCSDHADPLASLYPTGAGKYNGELPVRSRAGKVLGLSTWRSRRFASLLGKALRAGQE